MKGGLLGADLDQTRVSVDGIDGLVLSLEGCLRVWVCIHRLEIDLSDVLWVFGVYL